MGRAGLEVWIVEDIAGSYEETPPTLQDELKRDRRWCQGNLQHLRLMFGQDIRAGHRTIFLAGIMTYASALFWLVFLGLSSVWIAVNAMTPPVYFSPQPSLFPIWPQWRPEWAIALFSTTALLLFTPKFLALALIVRRGQAALYGGIGALTAGIFIEIVLSALLAPVRMWFHAKFVLLTLLGRDIKWGAQQRTGNEIGWIQAFRMHGFSAGFALAWMAVVVWLDPAFSWWLVPITGPLVASTALSVYLSRDGRRFREARLLLIPDELEPPEAVKSLEKTLKHFQRQPAEPLGLMRLIADPSALALHLAFIRGKAAATSGARARNRKLRDEILRTGPGALRAKEKVSLLLDAGSLKSLQEEFWRFDNLAAHPGAVTLARHPRRGLGPRAHALASGAMGPVAESWQK
jgi:membrane glycosyltransferase